MWYHRIIGQTLRLDTWWQTETGAIMISPLPAPLQQNPVRNQPIPRHRRRDRQRARRYGAARRRGLPRAHAPVAFHVENNLWR